MENVIAYGPFLLRGTTVTIALSICSILLAVALGLAGAGARLSGSPLARRVAGTYTTIVRGVPDLVVMLLLYFGGQVLLNQVGALTGYWRYIELNQFAAGVMAIGFIFGAYMSETFRGAYMSIPKGMIEAGTSVGMARTVLFRRVIWPHSFALRAAGLHQQLADADETTALVSVIGLEDIVYNGFAPAGATREPFTSC